MPDVIVVGDATVDIIVPYPRFLNEERTLVDYPEPSLQGAGPLPIRQWLWQGLESEQVLSVPSEKISMEGT